MKQVGKDLIHITLPFRKLSYGQNRIDPVVSATVYRLDIKSVQFKNAKDVSILDNSLGQTNTMVPHIIGLLI